MNKPGVLLMFLGAILMAIVLFINVEFKVWVILFIISSLIAASGAVVAILELAKRIKLEKQNKQ